MSYSSNWFEKLAKNNFETFIKPIFEKKSLHYLEIGTFEGASLNYMFKNILSHVDSKATVIDPFNDFNNSYNQLQTFKNNLHDYLDRINIIQGYSQNELIKLEKESYDLIYIDGDHTSSAVFLDALLSFPLLKKGGYIIFDDYLWIHDAEKHEIVETSDHRLQHPNNPFTGINNFINIHKVDIELISSNWQLIIKKKE
jgi:predicted O-methyltransferase YrrM